MFLVPRKPNFIPHAGKLPLGGYLMGCFDLMSSPKIFLFISKSPTRFDLFESYFFPGGGIILQVIHYGSEFDVFLFYIPHRETFFYLNFLKQIVFFFWYLDFFIVMNGGGRWMVKKRLSDFTQTLFRMNFKEDKFLCIEKIVT